MGANPRCSVMLVEPQHPRLQRQYRKAQRARLVALFSLSQRRREVEEAVRVEEQQAVLDREEIPTGKQRPEDQVDGQEDGGPEPVSGMGEDQAGERDGTPDRRGQPAGP